MDNDSLELVAELWRRRVEWLWNECERTSGKPLDIEWLDARIIEDEEQ